MEPSFDDDPDESIFEKEFDVPEAEPSIEYSELWNCPKLLKFQCPQQWDALTPSDSPNARSCLICQRAVYRCTTADEFIQHGRLGHCVAIPREVVPGELGDWLGEPSPEEVTESELANQRIYEWWARVLDAQGALDPDQARQLRELL